MSFLYHRTVDFLSPSQGLPVPFRMDRVIYFAGSIRGGRADAAIYSQLIDRLRKFGRVFTEHVGSPSLTANGEPASPRDIHDRDLEWLRSSDVIVAEVTTP